MEPETTTATDPALHVDPAPAPPSVRFLGDRSRVTVVPLAWPLEVDGTAYTEVAIRRLTAAEVAAFVDRMRAEPDANLRWPMADVPDHVIDAMDADDAYAINLAITDFLPRQFRGETAPA